MTDFETHARAAARAVHDAVEPPDAELRVPDRAGRGPVRAVLIAAAVVIIAAVVGTTLVTRDEGAGPASDVATFCAQVETLVTTPVDWINGERASAEPSLDFLRDTPEEIRPSALAILRSRTERDAQVSVEDSQRFLRWWQLRCYPDAATAVGGADSERYTPVTLPPGFSPCGAVTTSDRTTQQLADMFGTITIYGDVSLSDPYAGPMIGIVRTREQLFYRDDHAAPITVPGHPDAELIDATGLYGAPIAGLGQAITWKEPDGVVTVIGRGYTREQAGDLAALAATVREGDEGPTLTDAPGSLTPLYTGPVGDVYTVDVPSYASTTYTVSYETATGMVTLSGMVTRPGAREATRFFAPLLRGTTIDGRDATVGTPAVTNTAPDSVARIAVWNEGDVTLTLRSTGTERPTEAAFAEVVSATERLDRPAWERLIESGAGCRWMESSDASSSDSSSGASSGSGVASPTSTTAPVGTPAP